ncbi:hypothetical protein H4R33_001159 [Dimargaris cristalligena]|nr:hypothetical protein H4R33_001159 [Dimargaris cristalligena]
MALATVAFPELVPSDPLHVLPTDVLIHIFEYLSFPDLTRCLRVSRLWYSQLPFIPYLWRELQYPSGSTNSNGSAGPSPTAKAVQRALQLSGPRLRSLVVGQADRLTLQCLDTLARCPRPQLRHLALVGARRIDGDRLVRTIRGVAGTLTRLNLAGCSLSDRVVAEILSMCTHLRSLNVSHCTQLSRYMLEGVRLRTPTGSTNTSATSYTLPRLIGSGSPSSSLSSSSSVALVSPPERTLPPLAHFICRQNQACASPGIWNTLCHHYATTLREIDWTSTGEVSVPMLRNLALCTGLQCLNISHCRFTGPAEAIELALVQVGERCPQLERLYLAHLVEMTESQVRALVGLNSGWRICDLAHVHHLSDAFLRTFSIQAPRLTHLNVAGCFQCTDVGLSHIIKRCTALVYLNVSKCAVTDLFLSRLLRYAKNIRTLILDGCSSISSGGMQLVVTQPAFLRQLEHLSLYNCIKVNYDTAQALRKGMSPDAHFRYYFSG